MSEVGKHLDPEYFEDKVTVEQYNKLSKIVYTYNVYKADDGTEVNLLGLKPKVVKKMSHLPDWEREMLMIRYNRFSKLKSLLGKYKRLLGKKLGDDFENVLEIRKTHILELFGMHYGVEEVHRKLTEESGLHISFSSVRRFHKKYRVNIEKLQLDYEKDVGAIGISRKRSRLEVLDYMLRKIKQEFDQTGGQKQLPFSREMTKILEQARKEVEGEKVHLDVNGNINITATIESAKSVEALYSDINFMNLLVARVAARMRINPLLLQYQLTNSWYSKHTGVKRNNSIMEDEPYYPSKIILNWSDLQDKAAKHEEKMEKLKKKYTDEVEIIPNDEEKEEAKKLREALKDKIKDKQNILYEIKNRINKGNNGSGS